MRHRSRSRTGRSVWAQDLFVLGLGYLALKHPIAALVVAIAALVAVLIFLGVIVRALKRRFGRPATVN